MDNTPSLHTFEQPSDLAERAAREVIGAAIEVHRHLSAGHKEIAYKEALCIELGLRGIRFERDVPVTVNYKGHVVARGSVDLIVMDALVVELKAAEQIVPAHVGQTIAYLKMTAHRLGLILNFHVAVLKDGGIRRVILS
jgi:GxxExxY protein